MKPRKKLLIVAHVADLSNLSPGLAGKIAREAKNLKYRVEICLRVPGKLSLDRNIVAIFEVFNALKNFQGVDLVFEDLECGTEDTLIAAFNKLEANANKAVEIRKFPRYFDCPFVLLSRKKDYNYAEVTINRYGDVFMRSDCMGKKNILGNIARNHLRKMLANGKMIQKKLLVKILGNNFERKLSCRICSRVAKTKF